jgi:hypothetical protein
MEYEMLLEAALKPKAIQPSTSKGKLPIWILMPDRPGTGQSRVTLVQ